MPQADEVDDIQDDDNQSESPTFGSFADFLASKDSDEANQASEARTAPAADPDSDTEAGQAAAGDEGDAQSADVSAGADPEQTPEQVAEAARTLAKRANETKRERRIREINEEIAGWKSKETQAKTAADAEEQRLARLRAEREQLEAQRPGEPQSAKPPATAHAQATPAATSAPLARPVPPNPEDVGSDAMPDWPAYQAAQAKYVKDEADWSVAEARRVAAEAVAQERQSQERQRFLNTWQARVTEASAKRPDFIEKVIHNPNLIIGPDLAQLCAFEPGGDEVAYYLGTHTEEAARIARLSPLAQATEFGRLSSRLTVPVTAPSKAAGPSSSAKPVSQTPRPTSPVRAASASSQVPTERLSLTQFIDQREAQLSRSGGR